MTNQDKSVRRPRARGIEIVASLLLLSTTGFAQTSESPAAHWIQGSWVNVRAEGGIKANVITHLTINTPVKLIARQDRWCEIKAATMDVNGFVACNLLGTRPLALAEVANPELADGSPNPRYSPTRAFWLAPSVSRLLAAGDFFETTMLSAAQQRREAPLPEDWSEEAGAAKFNLDKPPNLVRYPVPEFETMKAVLAQGIVADAAQKPDKPIKWTTLKAAIDSGRQETYPWYLDERGLALMKKFKLKPAKPSLFKRIEELVPRSTGVEQMSALFGIKEKLIVNSGPKWLFSKHEDPRVNGSWDIGSYAIELEEPVYEYAIGRRGLAAAKEWLANQAFDAGAEEGCVEGYGFEEKGLRPLPGYPTVKDPFVWIYTPKPLPFKKLKIVRTATRPEYLKTDERMYGALTLVVMHEVDVDGDGVFDLAVQEGFASLEEPMIRLVFANIASEWYLLAGEQYGECT